jgi:kynureninase
MPPDGTDALGDEARQRDDSDPLRDFRERFTLPAGIYLDGNSLGLLCEDAEASTLRVLQDWRQRAIGGWTDGPEPWFFFAERLAARMAPLLGADADEVIVTGSTTTNLHQLLGTLYDARSDRRGLMVDALAFPSDRYAVESHLRLRGADPGIDLVVAPSRDGQTLGEADMLAAMTPDVQIAVLPSVVYTSGQLLDMEVLTREAHRRGVVIGWDCSHSVGAVPHALSAWGADFAFWCSYKYLNGGPGAVGGLYLNRRHHRRLPGLAGWFSSRKDRQFDMSPTLIPADGAAALQIGTPHVLSMAPLEGALRLHEEAGIDAIRAKSLALTSFLRAVAEERLTRHGMVCVTPREDARRGGHIALRHRAAAAVSQALRQRAIVVDFRPPDLIRLAPAPLVNTFGECLRAVEAIDVMLESGACAHGAGAPVLIP